VWLARKFGYTISRDSRLYDCGSSLGAMVERIFFFDDCYRDVP
jgi:hypothetical protein